MNLEALKKPTAPFKHALLATPSETADSMAKLESQGPTVRFVRGRKATTKQQLFDEVSAALQFPYYFGENWDALAECLSELPGLKMGAGFVLVLTDAVRLLDNADPLDVKTFIDLLDGAIASRDEHGKKSAHPFHVVFQGEPSEASALAKKWPGSAPLG